MPSLFVTTSSRVTAECLSVGFFVALIQRLIMGRTRNLPMKFRAARSTFALVRNETAGSHHPARATLSPHPMRGGLSEGSLRTFDNRLHFGDFFGNWSSPPPSRPYWHIMRIRVTAGSKVILRVDQK